MKLTFTLLFGLLDMLCVSAQWSNTDNTFTNDLHMPVCTTTGDQLRPMVISSKPDGGYFIIWEDQRNGFGAPFQIYAQKFDKNGKALWATNGIPVSTGTNNQQYTFNSNQDYRNRKVAASDNNGGLFITYGDDSLNSGDWKRVCVQHLTSTGTRVFPNAGAVMAATPVGQTYSFVQPQLIADNDGGFYLAYFSTGHALDDLLYIYNYSDNGGTLVLNGGGLVNDNTISTNIGNPCGGPRFALSYPGTTVTDYNIWPDLQGNCSVAFSMNGNTGSQGYMLGFNKVWKAKADQTISITRIDANFNVSTTDSSYHKGAVDILYQVRVNAFDLNCGSGPDLFVWVDYNVISRGFLVLDQSEYPFNNVKGVTLATGGNINAELVAANAQYLVNNVASAPVTIAKGFTDEIYAAIPYQRATNTNYNTGYNTQKPPGMDSVEYFSDTVLAPGIYTYDFSLAGGGSHAYLSGLMWEVTSDPYNVRLQHLSTGPDGAGLYRINYETGNKKGDIIGKELSTGFSGTDIDYDFPLVTANTTGNALFSINENGRYARVSPILTGTQLAWGAMGRPIGTPQVNNQYINPAGPAPALDPVDGTGVIAWYDQRNINAGNGQDIFIRHLDDLNVASYAPPNKKVLPLPGGILQAYPLVLTGTTMKYSPIELLNGSTGAITPVTEILDNYDLGAVQTALFENIGAIRSNAGKPYLDRNFAITPEHNPAGAADINVRLYFTTAEFNALKAADPGITDPGSLSVIKQTNTTNGNAVTEFTPDGSEIELKPIDWQTVDGGYFVEVVVNSFSNFFIQRSVSPLPLTWLGVQAAWVNAGTAAISWQVSDQQNVKDYIVQQSTDGASFTNGCSVLASSSTSYSCTMPASGDSLTYYRVLQRDLDGKFTYSKTVVLKAVSQTTLILHPNPVKDNLYIDNLAGVNTLQISDLGGRILLARTALAGTGSVDVSFLPPGLYIVTIKNTKDTKSFKFIKQ